MSARWYQVSDETTANTRHKVWRCSGCRRLAVTGCVTSSPWGPGDMNDVSSCTCCTPQGTK